MLAAAIKECHPDEKQPGRDGSRVDDCVVRGESTRAPDEVVAVEEHPVQQAVHRLILVEALSVPADVLEHRQVVEVILDAVGPEREARDRNGDQRPAGHEAPLASQQAPHHDQRQGGLDRADRTGEGSAGAAAARHPRPHDGREQQIDPGLDLPDVIRADDRVVGERESDRQQEAGDARTPRVAAGAGSRQAQ